MKNLIILVAFVFVASMACFPIQSDDFYMYLALGKKFFDSGAFPTTDPYIFSISNYPWVIMHQWLSYLIFYSVYLVGGFDLIVLFKFLVIAATVFLPLYLIKKSKNFDIKKINENIVNNNSTVPLLAWLSSAALALNGITFRLMERSSLFSDLFIVLVLVILFSESQKPNRLKYFLPLIFLVWVNTHPVFPVGLFLCFVYLVFNFKKFKQPEYLKFAAASALSLLACLINPNFISGFLYPLNFANQEASVFRQFYTEWMPTLAEVYRYRLHTLFLILLSVLNILLLLLNRKNYLAWALSVFFIFYGFYAIRFAPTMCFALITINTYLSLNVFEKFSLNSKAIYKNMTIVFASLVFLISIKNIIRGQNTISGYREFGLGVDQKFMPSGAVAYINLNGDKIGNVLNTHLTGSYLSWMWEGKRKIFYHGFMTDTNFYLKEYLGFFDQPKNFDRLVDKYNIDCILIDRYSYGDTLLKNVATNPNWKLGYKDDISMVFLKN